MTLFPCRHLENATVRTWVVKVPLILQSRTHLTFPRTILCLIALSTTVQWPFKDFPTFPAHAVDVVQTTNNIFCSRQNTTLPLCNERFLILEPIRSSTGLLAVLLHGHTRFVILFRSHFVQGALLSERMETLRRNFKIWTFRQIARKQDLQEHSLLASKELCVKSISPLLADFVNTSLQA
jgi:hypothetical protein